MNDWELLEQFRETRCDRAFGELVARHAGFVYATCRRRVRDAHLAEDVTQAVFIVLARRPPVQCEGVPLSAWLYRTAIYACNNAMRSHLNRSRHEDGAMQQDETASTDSSPRPISIEVEAQLDEAIASLSRGDRDVLFLRYYEDRDLHEIGAALQLSEKAASKRATRALDRLRVAFARGGHALSASALHGLLQQPAPAELIARTLSSALSGTSEFAVESITQGVIKMTLNAKAKLVAAVVAIVVIGGATLSIPLVFAKAPSMSKAAAPTSQPATQPAKPDEKPVDLSTPKGALIAFANATRMADFATLRRASKAEAQGDDLESSLIAASNTYQKAMGELFSAVRAKFGDAEVRKFMRQRGAVPLEPFLRLVEVELDQHDIVIDGDSAKVVDRKDGNADTGIKLIREGGVWKVTATGLVAQFGNEQANQRVEMLTMRAEILGEVAAEVAADKYENIEAVGNGLRDALRRR